MKIAGLHIYPLKGGAALDLSKAEVTPKGLKHDRVLMAVNTETNTFVTQRENRKLATVGAVPDDEGVTLSAQYMEDLRLTWRQLENGDKLKTNLWSDTVDAKSSPQAASDWLSQAIGQSVALIYQPQDALRPTNPTYAPDGQSSFSDGYPILVAFTKSLDDLNRRIEEGGGDRVTMDRFRPNIVIVNDKAWEEDTIGRLRTGVVELSLVKPCTRCVVTTLDQSTGEKKGVEPLRTLANFRFSPEYKGVLFAENAVPHNTGMLEIGDDVVTLFQKSAPSLKLKGQKI